MKLHARTPRQRPSARELLITILAGILGLLAGCTAATTPAPAPSATTQPPASR